MVLTDIRMGGMSGFDFLRLVRETAHDSDVVMITAAYGLGENVVQGAVDPDELYVHKPTFEQGYRAVLRRRLGSKKIKMIYGRGGTRNATRNVTTTPEESVR